MTTLFALVGGIAVLVCVLITLTVRMSLPRSARIPIHIGVRGFDNFVGRTFGLILWPAMTTLLYVIGLLTPDEGSGTGDGILLAVLLILPVFAYMAYQRADLEADDKADRR